MTRFWDLWHRITVASRVMLPAYIVLFFGLGLNYTVLTDDRVNDSPTLSYADALLDLALWGCMFIAISVLLVWAVLTGSENRCRFALWLGIICMGLWSVVFAAAAIFSTASFGGFLWPAFPAVACFASNRSLLKGES